MTYVICILFISFKGLNLVTTLLSNIRPRIFCEDIDAYTTMQWDRQVHSVLCAFPSQASRGHPRFVGNLANRRSHIWIFTQQFRDERSAFRAAKPPLRLLEGCLVVTVLMQHLCLCFSLERNTLAYQLVDDHSEGPGVHVRMVSGFLS